MIRWWRAWRWRCEQRKFEVFLFNHGSVGKWMEIREFNDAAGVWRRWPL